MPTSFPPAGEREAAARLAALMHQRRARFDVAPPRFLADPAWDLLLELTAARIEDRPGSLAEACRAAEVPEATGRRWAEAMAAEGIVERTEDGGWCTSKETHDLMLDYLRRMDSSGES